MSDESIQITIIHGNAAPDFTEANKLIAAANLEMGRITQQEYEAEIQQLEAKQKQLAPGGQENE